MAQRAYHNLAGFVRDLTAAIAAGHQLAYELAELIAEVDDLIDASVALPEGDALEEPRDEVDLPDAADEPALGGPAPGHGAVCGTQLVPGARMEPQMGHRRAEQLSLAGARGVAPTLARTRRVGPGEET